MYYYSDAEQKNETRKETILTIDTRNIHKNGDFDPIDTDFEEAPIPPLQLAIQTKYETNFSDF